MLEPQEALRRRLALVQGLAGRGVNDPQVLHALRTVPRHRFVPEELQEQAYEDRALAVGLGQTISQPYVVAAMSQALRLQAGDSVLEVGTGTGYQAAVLAELASQVFTIERLEPLRLEAARRLEDLCYRNVVARGGDGALGWPERAPFDAVLVACGAEHVPPALVQQLRAGGRLVVPVGPRDEVMDLLLIEKDGQGVTTSRSLMPVRFVPLLRG